MPCRLQVSSTAGITVGRWVRLFAQNPTAVAAPALRRLLSAEPPAVDLSDAEEASEAIDVQQEVAVVVKLSAQQLGITADSWESLIDQLMDQIDDLPQQLRELLQELLSGDLQDSDATEDATEQRGGKGHKHKHGSSGRRGGRGKGSGSGGSKGSSKVCDKGKGSGKGGGKGGSKGSSSGSKTPTKPTGGDDRDTSGTGAQGSSPAMPPPSPATPADNTDASPPSDASDTAGNETAPIVPRNGTAEEACADAPEYLALTETLREGCLDAEALGLSQPEEPPTAAANSTNSTGDGSGDKAPGLAAGGTLDAYIYGRLAGAASGTSECSDGCWRWRVFSASCAGFGWLPLVLLLAKVYSI